MYSTCIGLILKGYSDYENKTKDFHQRYTRVAVPGNLKTSDFVNVTEPLKPMLLTPVNEKG